MSSITATPIDFSTTPLAGPYPHFFALILDNVFTASECLDLIKLAETAPWEPASSYPPFSGNEYDHISHRFRHSDRIVRDDPETAQMIFERIRKYLGDVAEIGPDSKWIQVTGNAAQKWSSARGETGFWRLTK
jgi:Txe/YoeB family toxin of Txe-Axe toxin-antitoxin module